MVNVLVLGWSDIVRRRVIPALTAHKAVNKIHIATSTFTDFARQDARVTSVYDGPDGIQKALEIAEAELVYVSGKNSSHGSRVIAALESDRHVIVDKPAILDPAERFKAFALSEKKRLVLEEATVWTLHPQVKLLEKIIAERKHKVDLILASFRVPMFDRSNFRLCASAGGGAIADMGVYATSAGRSFGCGRPISMDVSITRFMNSFDSTSSETENPDVDIGFTFRSVQESGAEMIGTFGFGTAYLNRITILGAGLRAQLQPAFSSKPDQWLKVSLEFNDKDYSFNVPPADPFQLLIDDVLRRISGPLEQRRPSDKLVSSSQDLDKLKLSINKSLLSLNSKII